MMMSDSHTFRQASMEGLSLVAPERIDSTLPQRVCAGVLTGPAPCAWCPDPGLPVGAARGRFEAALRVDRVLALAQAARFRFAWHAGELGLVAPDKFSPVVVSRINGSAPHIKKRMSMLVELQPVEPGVVWVAAPARLLVPCLGCEPEVRG